MMPSSFLAQILVILSVTLLHVPAVHSRNTAEHIDENATSTLFFPLEG